MKKTSRRKTKRKTKTSRKKPKSTEQLRKEAIKSIDRNLANGKSRKRKQHKSSTNASNGKTTSTKGKQSYGMSGLDAAAKILKEAKKAMRCGQMIEVMFKKRYWSSEGKTPAATLYSAILREINTKGKDSRFKKVDRGQFQLRKGA